VLELLLSDAPSNGAGPYRGPERRSMTAQAWRWFAAAWDEVDYGMLLLGEDAGVLHANDLARAALDAPGHPLQLRGGTCQARHARDGAALRAALHDAMRRGLRRLVALGEGTQPVDVSVVPLGPRSPDGRPVALVVLGKRQVCSELAVQGFARSHQLTPSETRVLLALCNGARPADAARMNGVAISTVRTQIRSIRQKTGAASIPALVQRAASLPPLMGVLRFGDARHACGAGTLIAA
jgi:DNA-binding CsgD family transcriptional regulator